MPRDSDSLDWLDNAVRDLRLAIRSLWQARGFALAVVVPLAGGLAVLAVVLSGIGHWRTSERGRYDWWWIGSYGL